MIKLKGIATISENGFHFNSELRSTQHLLAKAQKMLGTLHITRNGCADFIARKRIILPPLITRICDGANYRVKRSSQNYLIQIKVPIVENRQDTAATLAHSLTIIMNEITLDRHDLLKDL